MPLRQHLVGLAIMALIAMGSDQVHADSNAAPGNTHVTVQEHTDGTFALLRNGKPYVVKGAGTGSGQGLQPGSLAMLAESGGNSIRTWGISQLEHLIDGKNLLDRAHELGISVSAGLWVQHARHGFDYGDTASIERQRKQLRDSVLKYMHHPALLTWGLGNEMEELWGPGETDVRIWQELNHLAAMIKELDPHHPVMTVIAGSTPSKIKAIQEHYPNLDILGVNAYASATGVGQRLFDSGWRGPYMLTEYGVTGPWEATTTAWDAPIEQDPSTKAGTSYSSYKLDRDNNIGRTLGSYVFFWGSKQEATSTWFGMFLPSGEKLPRVDAMAYAWSGSWPENRAPKLRSMTSPVAHKKVRTDSLSYAEVDCIDREGKDLKYIWDIRAESTDRGVGGDPEAIPPSFAGAIKKGQGTNRIEFRIPKQPGAYRVFVTAYDGDGGAAAHNLPFMVEQ